MKRLIMLLSAVALTASVTRGQNLLLNGDFNSPTTVAAPDVWSIWTYGGGYANHEIITPAASVLGNYDGTYQMTIGAANTSGGGGVYQTIAATAGLNYELGVQAGAQDWWLPTGQIRLFFYDASNTQLALTQINVTDSIHAPDQYNVGVAYQYWSLSALAPAGTTQAKVEFAGYGGGSVWFDNASLTVVAVPEPGTVAMLAVGSVVLLACRPRRRANSY